VSIQTEDLLPLALSRPHEAADLARAVLADDPTPLDASMAHQAIGIVLREFGDIDAAIAELRSALRLARRSGCSEREADVLGTLGVALVFGGRTAAGRKALDGCVERSRGLQHGRSRLRRGATLLRLGLHRDALTDLNVAISSSRAAEDLLWEARGLEYRGYCHLALGSVHRATADLLRAGELFTACGQDLESIDMTVQRGVLALRIGDLPAALTCFDEAEERFSELGTVGTVGTELSIHRSAALLAAGLPQEALTEAETAIRQLDEVRGSSTVRAELLLTSATCALAAGRPDLAQQRAAEACRLFDQQDRYWWRAHARLALVRAGFAAGPATEPMLREAQRCGRELASLSSPEVPLARLLTGRIALALGRTRTAGQQLAAAAQGRRTGPALSRAVAWLAEALRAEAAGSPRQLMHACRRGLDVIDEHRGALGSSELRAQGTAHGAELALLGQRDALRRSNSRLLLSWSERWRASALAVPAVLPPDDEQSQADLGALRDVTSRLARASAEGLPTAALHRDQLRLERAVRTRALRTRGSGSATTGPGDPGRRDVGPGDSGASDFGPSDFDVDELLAELGDDRLVELIDTDGQLQVLVCGGGRVRRFPAGRTEQVARDVEFARATLTRLAYGMSTGPAEQSLARLARLGDTLNRSLLGEAGRQLGDGEVIVVPPGRLHAVPWPLLTDLRHRVLTVAPSATLWLRARKARRATPDSNSAGGVVLVHGPGLSTGDAEVPLLAAQYAADAERARRVTPTGPGDEAVVLGGGSATAARVLAAIDGARLAHIAAHGTFRADSPLFSALQLDDGPLTVYDLERLRRAPRQIVLSSCDSAVAAPAGTDELLGLASALIPLGTTGIVASVVPVNDVAVIRLMTALHEHLRNGTTLSEAVQRARNGMQFDPVEAATSLSFLALGTG
jgi:tetratricopeptide (TPR) repeat protein